MILKNLFSLQFDAFVYCSSYLSPGVNAILVIMKWKESVSTSMNVSYMPPKSATIRLPGPQTQAQPLVEGVSEAPCGAGHCLNTVGSYRFLI